MQQEINYSFDSIPAELKELKQWLCFEVKSVPGKEKLEKIPWHYSGKFKASSTNPSTWCTFDEAVATAQQRINGINAIGFAFSENDPYIGIDLDNVLDGNNLNGMANEIIDIADSYTEYSTSKTGVHIIINGALPDYITSTGKRNDKYGIEIYSSGRMFIFTGDVIANEGSIYERSDQLGEIIEKHFSMEQLAQYTETSFNSEPFNPEDDSDTWRKMFNNSVTGQDVQAMFKGELIRNGDWSSTDYYLCQELAYYCDKDFIKMDRMFRNSGLYREKWDKDHGATTYGVRTLIRAASSKKLTISDYRNKNELQIQVNDSFVFPKGYISKNGCLYNIVEKKDRSGEIEEIEVLICRQTPIITRSFMNVEHPQLYHELSWSDKGKVYKEVIPAGDLAIKKELLKLSYKSLAVTDNNAKNLITYFDRLCMVNNLDNEYLVERLGHIKDTFVHPLKVDGVKILPPDIGERQLLDAFQTSGTSEEWIENVFKPIKKHPKALLMVLASFASVLLQDLKMKPFIVDLSGVTSQGKTTVLRACASVWGSEHLVSEWSLTKVAAERKAAFLNSFPIILDDTRKADEKQLQSFIYAFSGGRSRGRGSVSGSQREYTWGNLLLSTGEDSLNAYAERAGGVAARILPITGLPFQGENYQFFTDL